MNYFTFKQRGQAILFLFSFNRREERRERGERSVYELEIKIEDSHFIVNGMS